MAVLEFIEAAGEVAGSGHDPDRAAEYLEIRRLRC